MSDCLQINQLYAMLQGFVDNDATGAQVALYTNAKVPTSVDTYSEFTEVDATWYTRKNATYGQVHDSESVNMETVVQSLQWNYSDGDGSDDPITIQGYMVLTPSGNTLLHSRRLDAPVTLATDIDSVVVRPSVTVKSIPQS